MRHKMVGLRIDAGVKRLNQTASCIVEQHKRWLSSMNLLDSTPHCPDQGNGGTVTTRSVCAVTVKMLRYQVMTLVAPFYLKIEKP